MWHIHRTQIHTSNEHIALQAGCTQLNWHFLTKKLLFSPLLAIYIIISSTYPPTWLQVGAEWREQTGKERSRESESEKHMLHINCTWSRSWSTNANEKIYIDDFYEWNEMKHIWPQKWKIYDCFGSAFDFEKLLPGKPNSIKINEPSSIETKSEPHAQHVVLCCGVVCGDGWEKWILWSMECR